ncbi:MAG: flavin monoamine oxidase family protein [Acidimicrobiales bacterium]
MTTNDASNSGSIATGDVDVVVVGGGIAGLVATTRLIDAGLTCVVLESRDRVGGRLLTHDTAAGRFDLGATWFWPGEQRVEALIDELGVATHGQHLAGDAMYHVAAGAQRIAGNPIDVASGRFSNGAASLAERLAASLGDAVQLQARVHRIEHDQPELRVHYAGGSLTARHVVLALPPSLAVHQIEFRPVLPDPLQRLAAATPVWMGNVAKAVAVYPSAFWRSDGLAGAAISHLGPLREVHDMSGPDGAPAALFGFAPLAPGVPTPTEDEIVAQLVELFGPQAATPTEVLVKDWRADSHTVPPVIAAGTAMSTYAHPLYQQPAGNGRIHWASTETAPVAPGHIEGAIAAAERAIAPIIGTPTRLATRSPGSSLHIRYGRRHGR